MCECGVNLKFRKYKYKSWSTPRIGIWWVIDLFPELTIAELKSGTPQKKNSRHPVEMRKSCIYILVSSSAIPPCPHGILFLQMCSATVLNKAHLAGYCNYRKRIASDASRWINFCVYRVDVHRIQIYGNFVFFNGAALRLLSLVKNARIYWHLQECIRRVSQWLFGSAAKKEISFSEFFSASLGSYEKPRI